MVLVCSGTERKCVPPKNEYGLCIRLGRDALHIPRRKPHLPCLGISRPAELQAAAAAANDPAPPGGKRVVASPVLTNHPAPTAVAAATPPYFFARRFLQAQLVEFALIRPRIGIGYQPGANGILAHVFPFCIVMCGMPELRVPEIALPDRLLAGPRPAAGNQGFPITHPLPQRSRGRFIRCAEQMHVIRHHDETPDHPTRRITPCILQQPHHIGCRKDGFAGLCADGEKNDCRFIEPLDHRWMNRMFPPAWHFQKSLQKTPLGGKRAVASPYCRTTWRRRRSPSNLPPLFPSATSAVPLQGNVPGKWPDTLNHFVGLFFTGCFRLLDGYFFASSAARSRLRASSFSRISSSLKSAGQP